MARISHHCWSLILGTLLGDAWLSDNIRKNRKNSFLGVLHTTKHSDYVDHKYHILQEIGVGKPYIKSNPAPNGTVHYVKGFKTTAHPLFTALRKQLYKKGKKRVSCHYLNKLTDASVAYWFMDDGSLVWHKRKRKQGVIYSTCEFYLATNGFVEEDIDNIVKWFYEKYQVCGRKRYHKPTKSYAIVFNRKDYILLLQKIGNYYIPIMNYKKDLSKLGTYIS